MRGASEEVVIGKHVALHEPTPLVVLHVKLLTEPAEAMHAVVTQVCAAEHVEQPLQLLEKEPVGEHVSPPDAGVVLGVLGVVLGVLGDEATQ